MSHKPHTAPAQIAPLADRRPAIPLTAVCAKCGDRTCFSTPIALRIYLGVCEFATSSLFGFQEEKRPLHVADLGGSTGGQSIEASAPQNTSEVCGRTALMTSASDTPRQRQEKRAIRCDGDDDDDLTRLHHRRRRCPG